MAWGRPALGDNEGGKEGRTKCRDLNPRAPSIKIINMTYFGLFEAPGSKGSIKGDLDLDVEVGVDMDRRFWLCKGGFKVS